jgi:hypothetical protein
LTRLFLCTDELMSEEKNGGNKKKNQWCRLEGMPEQQVENEIFPFYGVWAMVSAAAAILQWKIDRFPCRRTMYQSAVHIYSHVSRIGPTMLTTCRELNNSLIQQHAIGMDLFRKTMILIVRVLSHFVPSQTNSSAWGCFPNSLPALMTPSTSRRNWLLECTVER